MKIRDLLTWWQDRSRSLLYHFGKTWMTQSWGCCLIPVVSTQTQTIKAINQGSLFVKNGLSCEGFESLTLTCFCFSNVQLDSEVLSWQFWKQLGDFTMIPGGGWGMYSRGSAHEPPWRVLFSETGAIENGKHSWPFIQTSLTFRDFPSIEWALTTAFNFILLSVNALFNFNFRLEHSLP